MHIAISAHALQDRFALERQAVIAVDFDHCRLLIERGAGVIGQQCIDDRATVVDELQGQAYLGPGEFRST